MIYEAIDAEAPLSQGDIIDRCQIVVREDDPVAEKLQPIQLEVRIAVLTQACDLAQSRTNRILVAVVHDAELLVEKGLLKAKTISDQLRSHRIYGWYFLPAGPIPESIVDLRDLHTVPRWHLEKLVSEGQRRARIATPFREHLAQHFATTYSRIGLPEPYSTRPKH